MTLREQQLIKVLSMTAKMARQVDVVVHPDVKTWKDIAAWLAEHHSDVTTMPLGWSTYGTIRGGNSKMLLWLVKFQGQFYWFAPTDTLRVSYPLANQIQQIFVS